MSVQYIYSVQKFCINKFVRITPAPQKYTEIIKIKTFSVKEQTYKRNYMQYIMFYKQYSKKWTRLGFGKN